MPSFIAHRKEWIKIIEETQSVESYLAVSWVLDQIVPFMQPKPHQWQIVTYEELVANPTETLIEIAKKWKTPISIEKALAQLQKPSSTVHETGVSKLNSWQLQRGVDTIKRVPLMFRSGSEQAEPVFRLAVKASK